MPMFQAIESGDAEEVKRLLKTDPTLLEAVYIGWSRGTSLVYATITGPMGIVKLLVEEGANIHATGYFGRTALHYAAEQGHEGMVAYLLDNGASSIHQDGHGNTPLMRAAMSGHAHVAVLLLEHMAGEGLEARSSAGHTALHLAVLFGYKEMVAQLLRHGARADTTDKRGTSALMSAAASRRPLGVMRRLLEHMGGQGLNQRDPLGRTALHYAVDHDRRENVRALLLAGADPTIVTNQGRTPAALARMYAMRKYHAENVALFDWWDGELERAFVISRAKALRDTYMKHQEAPTHPVPGYLKARVEAGPALPRVEVVTGQEGGAGWEGGRKRTRAATRTHAAGEQQGMNAIVGWVMTDLSEELFTELLQAFH